LWYIVGLFAHATIKNRVATFQERFPGEIVGRPNLESGTNPDVTLSVPYITVLLCGISQHKSEKGKPPESLIQAPRAQASARGLRMTGDLSEDPTAWSKAGHLTTKEQHPENDHAEFRIMRSKPARGRTKPRFGRMSTPHDGDQGIEAGQHSSLGWNQLCQRPFLCDEVGLNIDVNCLDALMAR
jgi:hypothetical protein